MAFIARAFDYAVVLAVLDPSGLHTLPLHPVLNSMAAGVAWIPLAAFLLGKWGTTPGKWILRTSVDPLIFTFGVGCFITFVSLAAGLKSYWDLHETGTTSWDRKKYQVSHEPIAVGRYCLARHLAGTAKAIIELPAATATYCFPRNE